MPTVVANHGLLVAAGGLYSYIDNANRADSTTSTGPDWQTMLQPAAGYPIHVVSNAWAIGWASAWHIQRNNAAVPPWNADVKVSIQDVVAGSAHRIYLGSNDSHQIYAELANFGGAVTIYTRTGTWATSGDSGRTARGSAGTAAASHNVNHYLQRVWNGSAWVYTANFGATNATWTDSGAAHPVDSSHYETGMAMNAVSTSYRLDDFRVDQL